MSKSWTFLAATAIVCAIGPLSIIGSSDASARGHASASPTPEATIAPVTYNTIDGIWEVQLQPGSLTIYSHFSLLTNGNTISGIWNRNNKPTQLSGTLTGDHFTLSGNDLKGPFTMAGYIENSATMVAQLTQGTSVVTFTATHQGLPSNERPPKQKHAHAHRHHRGETATEAGDSTLTPATSPTP